MERGPGGIPILTLPSANTLTSPKKLFERRCYLNGVTDKGIVASLWAEEAKRLAAGKAKKTKRPRRGKRTN